MGWNLVTCHLHSNVVQTLCITNICGIRLSYYQRVVAPSDASCSNAYLAELENRFLVLPAPSQQFSFSRLKLLGHILRHPDSFGFTLTSMPSKAYRFVRGSNRPGSPTPHRAEVTTAKLIYDYKRRLPDQKSKTFITHIGNLFPQRMFNMLMEHRDYP